MVALRLSNQGIEFPRRCVSRELTIPHRRIVLGKPLPESREFPLWKALHGPGDVGDGGHGNKATLVMNPAQLNLRLSAQRLRFTCGGRATPAQTCPDVTAAADKCNRLLDGDWRISSERPQLKAALGLSCLDDLTKAQMLVEGDVVRLCRLEVARLPRCIRPVHHGLQ